MTLESLPVRLACLAASICLLLSTVAPSAASDHVYPTLSPEQVAAVRGAIEEMTRNPRGPYLRIRWFCEDGTVLPPEPFACRPHGGGFQHAELRPEIEALGKLGFHFGTIYRSLDPAELLDAERASYRARELVVQAFLQRADDGWVMRRARYYRGARQVEDEEWAGRELLIGIFDDAEWVRERPLLASRLVETVPHGGSESLTARVRTLAVELAELDNRFTNLRIKLHSVPGPADIGTVEVLLSQLEPEAPAEVTAKLRELLEGLRSRYGSQVDLERWRSLAAAGGSSAAPAFMERLIESAPATPGRVAILSGLAATSRARVDTEALAGRQTLALLELAAAAADRAAIEAAAWLEAGATQDRSRRQLVEVAQLLTAAAYGDGWITRREHEALSRAFESLLTDESMSIGEYHQRVQYIERVAAWAQASVHQAFAMVTQRYAPVEPAVGGLEDDLLRASVLLQLSDVVSMLARDSAAAIGQEHDILGTIVRNGILGLNPGLAIGPLYVAESLLEARAPDPDGIYALPGTPPELGRVAGILTTGQGSRLSHVQLLARGLGIPNASISQPALELLRAHVGDRLVYSVSPQGSVYLAHAEEAEELPQDTRAERDDLRIDEERLDLSVREVLPLTELRASDAGRIAGPKAANLGQLHALFPDRVAPGLVIPFGLFRAHIEQPDEAGRPSILELISELYRTREDVPNRLAEIRTRIRQLPLLPGFESQLRGTLAEAFGPAGSYGVFVRSDTNVEDLPGFSGAGLNLTVMNVIGTDAILQAIRDVWASPFTERAYGWRSDRVANPEAIYPSILLLGSVAGEASGVLVTRDVDDVLRDSRGPSAHWTITLSPGVGGGVEGEASETTLVAANGQGPLVLLSSARAVWSKRLGVAGGIQQDPVAGDQQLLTDARLADLRTVVERIDRLYPRSTDAQGRPMPWDIEFGFVGDRTILFQIRPFIVGTATADLASARALDEAMQARAPLPLDLDAGIIQ